MLLESDSFRMTNASRLASGEEEKQRRAALLRHYKEWKDACANDGAGRLSYGANAESHPQERGWAPAQQRMQSVREGWATGVDPSGEPIGAHIGGSVGELADERGGRLIVQAVEIFVIV